jgi:hypothetical protein
MTARRGVSRGVALMTTLALVAGLAFAPAGQAHKKRYPTTMTLVVSGDTATGVITTTKPACRAGRGVSVSELTTGAIPNGFGLSDSVGNYTVALFRPEVTNRFYFAGIDTKVLRKSKRHKHICPDAVSPNFLGD